MSDVKLEGDQVTLEGKQVKMKAWDLLLDSPDRRKNKSKFRRALVHDFDDGLTLNWAGDYPGGVTVQGALKADTVKLGQEIIVPITFDRKTGDILAPSELKKETLQSLLVPIASTDTSAKKPKPKGTSGRKSLHTFKDGLAFKPQVASNKTIQRFTLNVDLVKMVCQMAEDIEALRKEVKALKNT